MNAPESEGIRFYTDAIRAFVAVAEHRGLGRAARSLGLSQPSVSQQIARLEAAIGRKLFQRSKAGVALTQDGRVLLRHARSMIAVNEAIGRSFGIGGGKVRLKVGFTEMFSLTSINHLLWLMARQNPRLSLRISLARTEILQAEFEKGEFDVIVSGPFEGVSRADTLLCSIPLAWIGRADMPCPVPDPVPLVLPHDPSRLRTAMLTALEGANRSWTDLYEVSSVSTAVAAIEAGFGCCAALIDMPLQRSVQLDERSSLPPLPAMDYHLHHRPGRHDEVVSAFGAILREAAESSNRPGSAV